MTSFLSQIPTRGVDRHLFGSVWLELCRSSLFVWNILYEKSIFKTMTPYIITSSKFIATLRAAPEYVNKNFYLGGPGGRVGKNVQSALDLPCKIWRSASRS